MYGHYFTLASFSALAIIARRGESNGTLQLLALLQIVNEDISVICLRLSSISNITDNSAVIVACGVGSVA